MKQASHFCFGDGSHSDNCDCVCGPCCERKSFLKYQEISVKISLVANAEYEKILAEVLRDKPYLKNKNGR